jgi:hypothetical protein
MISQLKSTEILIIRLFFIDGNDIFIVDALIGAITEVSVLLPLKAEYVNVTRASLARTAVNEYARWLSSQPR